MKIARRLSPAWIVAALLILVVVLATLQYRWLGEVSEAQRERIRSTLEHSARLFAEDFDRELTRVFLHFQPLVAARGTFDGGEPSYADVHRRWTSRAPYPEMVAEVLRAEAGGAELERYDPATGELAAADWTPELAGLRRRLEEMPARGPGFPPPPDEGSWQLLDGDIPAVLLPSFQPAPRMRRGRMGGRDGRLRDSRPESGPRERFRLPLSDVVIVRLDPDVLRERVLADLAARHFGGGELECRVEVTDRGETPTTIFAAGPPVRGVGSGDASSELFGFLPFEGIRQLMYQMAFEDDADPSEPAARREDFGRSLAALGAAGRPAEPRWRLVATHPSGSLEAAVAAARRRNLAVSAGVLVLLGSTVLLLLAATRRAQETARQQLEFVAGVTHELRTPLAAMRSAGQNLADGVVHDRPQVERYGALIEREGRRLSDMVEQVLEYAGLQSGQRDYANERTSLGGVIEKALADCRPLTEEKGFEVETELAPGLPDVIGDAAALGRAVENLIVNAVKYGERGAWIAVRARAFPARNAASAEVEVTVEDRGDGIAPEDLPRLFEPFYRGRNRAAGRVPGSGLGLSLVRHIVEAHGGRVEAAGREGGGSVFTVRLPAARKRLAFESHEA